MNSMVRCAIVMVGFFALACSNDGAGSVVECGLDCGENGICDISTSPAVCRCFPGWQGQACDKCDDGYEDDGLGNCVYSSGDNGSCNTGSCSGHGLCQDDTGQVVCTCNLGYTGDRCDTCASGYNLDNRGNCTAEVNCSNSDPCGAHGECIDGDTGSYCNCEDGYTGSDCSECIDGYHTDGDLCVADERCPQSDPCQPGGVCDDTGGVMNCICGEGYTGVLCDRCKPGYTDSGNGCEIGESCYEYLFDNDTYVYEMDYGDEQTPCCFDYTDDGIPDNALGDLFSTIGSLIGMDANQILEDKITSGVFCQLFDIQDLDSVSDDDSLSLSIMSGSDSDDNYENNLDGSEEYTVGDDSFVWIDQVCTMEPLNVFDSASVEQGVITAQAEQLRKIFIPSAVAPDELSSVILKDAKLTASLQSGANGVIMTEGKMGGAVAVDEICEQFNDYVETNCDCLNLDGPFMTCAVDGDTYGVQCASSESQCEPDSSCDTLAQFCPFVSTMLESADLDMDLDGVNDSFSLGIRFSATSATVTGVSQ